MAVAELSKKEKGESFSGARIVFSGFVKEILLDPDCLFCLFFYVCQYGNTLTNPNTLQTGNTGHNCSIVCLQDPQII